MRASPIGAFLRRHLQSRASVRLIVRGSHVLRAISFLLLIAMWAFSGQWYRLFVAAVFVGVLADALLLAWDEGGMNGRH